MDTESPAPARRGRPKKNPAFEAHVGKIEHAKSLSGEFIGMSGCGDKTPQAVLNAAWEIVFDFFMRAREGGIEVSELNALAGVIQKLVSSGGALASQKTKGEERSKAAGLDADALRKIERKLKLL